MMKNFLIRYFNNGDIDFFSKNWQGSSRLDGYIATFSKLHSKVDIENLIAEWNGKKYNGKFFEAFAVVNDNLGIVGIVSLFQKEDGVSVGCSIDVNYQNQGFGARAVLLAIENAKKLGFKKVATSCKIDNYASIRLHEKCGMTFLEEKINAKGNMCRYYYKNI